MFVQANFLFGVLERSKGDEKATQCSPIAQRFDDGTAGLFTALPDRSNAASNTETSTTHWTSPSSLGGPTPAETVTSPSLPTDLETDIMMKPPSPICSVPDADEGKLSSPPASPVLSSPTDEHWQYSDFRSRNLGKGFLHRGGGGAGECRGDGRGKPNVAMNGNGKRMLEEECDERCTTKKCCFQVVE